MRGVPADHCHEHVHAPVAVEHLYRVVPTIRDDNRVCLIKWLFPLSYLPDQIKPFCFTLSHFETLNNDHHNHDPSVTHSFVAPDGWRVRVVSGCVPVDAIENL